MSTDQRSLRGSSRHPQWVGNQALARVCGVSQGRLLRVGVPKDLVCGEKTPPRQTCRAASSPWKGQAAPLVRRVGLVGSIDVLNSDVDEPKFRGVEALHESLFNPPCVPLLQLLFVLLAELALPDGLLQI